MLIREMEREEYSMEDSRSILYHEVQVSKLCALHCVNAVLQGPLFSAHDLADMALDLDRAERQMMHGSVSGDFLPEVSHNVSRDGDFSIQVLTKALEVWDLQVIPLDKPEVQPAQIDPESEKAYICHLHNHWFCLRKVDDEWYNFDSLQLAPEHLSKFYLTAYLDTLKTSGWSIFLVRGDLPTCPTMERNDYGQWMSPADAKRIFSKRQDRANRRRLRWGNSGRFENSRDDEEEDKALKEAIAASLKDLPPENKQPEERDAKRVKESPPENEEQPKGAVESREEEKEG